MYTIRKLTIRSMSLVMPDTQQEKEIQCFSWGLGRYKGQENKWRHKSLAICHAPKSD